MDTIEYSEIARDMRRVLEHEREKMVDKLQQVDEFLQLADQMDALISKVKSLQQEVEELQEKVDELQRQLEEKERQLEEKELQLEEKERQLEEKERQLEEKELQLTEFSKLTAGVAKKSSQEVLEKALRTYINISKRKTQAKREVARAQLLDFIATAKLEMSEDLLEQLNHLDDETDTAAPVIHIERAGDVIDKGGRKIVNNYQREGTND